MLKIIRYGQENSLVDLLQRCLAREGFRPGKIDGVFGPATEAAVMAFQRSQGLIPDGIVGPKTWAGLRPHDQYEDSNALGQVSIDLVAKMFPATRLDSIKRNLPTIIEALASIGISEKPLVLTALATIRAETEGFEPIDERPSRFNSSPGGHPFDLYDSRADLGNLGAPDGARFKGRGFVQLTGRDNYARFGEAIGIGTLLVREPHRANQPVLAARLLGTFVLSRADMIKRAVLDDDLRWVRRLVNGGSHGLLRFEHAFRTGAALLDDKVWTKIPA